jgi:hypothetical protein
MEHTFMSVELFIYQQKARRIWLDQWEHYKPWVIELI